ncbi:MAG: hypothetical protein AAGA85_00110 [Bacteroidota bacterium]
MRWFRLVLVLAVLATSAGVYGQTTVSPYSSSGLGELVYPGMPHNIAMGEVGIATPSYWSINSVNPALLANNQLTTFQVGFQGDYRNFVSAETTETDGTAGLRLLNISFPIKPRRWATAVALTPYSTVNYNFFETIPISDTEFEAVQAFEGEGGLSRLDWSHGIRLTGKLLVGVKASYIFGSIRRSSRSIVVGDESPFSISYNQSESYRDFLYQFGAFYKFNLSENKGINLGVIYTPSTQLSGTRDEAFTRINAGTPISTSEISEGVATTFDIAHELGIGVAYEDLNKFLVGVDFTIAQGGAFASDPTIFRETMRASIGLEYTPDYSSVTSYFNRVAYRAGFSLVQIPYLIQETAINDFGASFGASFPISGLSALDTAFKFGWRGTTADGLIRENYIQVVFGLTINDRWFIKRRYD